LAPETAERNSLSPRERGGLRGKSVTESPRAPVLREETAVWVASLMSVAFKVGI